MEQGSIFGAFLALHTPERSGLLAWSALPHAPVLADERAQKRAGRFRRAAARALSGLAERLDPQTGSTAPDGLRAGIGPAY